MGRDFSPVRKVFDYAEEHFLKNIPLCYVLTVTTAPRGEIAMHGLFIGRERRGFEEAVALSQQKNMTFMEKPIQKCVVLLDEHEFKTTWVGNKAVYRTRMAIADGGELIVLAPGVERFGEDMGNDAIIAKYGYCGRENVLRLVAENRDLQENLGAAAHLIHGSSDGRFSITYCTRKLSEEAVRSVHFDWAPYDEMVKRYNPETLEDGWNTLPDGEQIYLCAIRRWVCGPAGNGLSSKTKGARRRAGGGYASPAFFVSKNTFPASEAKKPKARETINNPALKSNCGLPTAQRTAKGEYSDGTAGHPSFSSIHGGIAKRLSYSKDRRKAFYQEKKASIKLLAVASVERGERLERKQAPTVALGLQQCCRNCQERTEI